MGLHETVSWYQRKIGTYDKQQWEKTVEQRILTGFKHVLKKTAKLKTDLIDVDLVRGSSFSKAKPKHGLATVTKLAIIRWLFLPFFWSWWIQQTCVAIFTLLLFLYITQIVNTTTYFYLSSLSSKTFERISAYEVIVPAGMMLILSLIHSEIVATSSCRPTEGFGISRNRRGKRQKSRQRIVEPVVEKDDHESGTERLSDTGNGLRRRTVAFRAPLREVAPPHIRTTEDDGFESLASHGSSEDVPGLKQDQTSNDITMEITEEDCTSWLPCKKNKKQSPCCKRCQSQDSAHFSDTDSELEGNQGSPQRMLQRRRSSKSIQVLKQVHYDSSCESDAAVSPLESRERILGSRCGGTSGSECLGVTTNSEECSVSSDVDDSEADSSARQMDDHPFAWEFQMTSSSSITPSCASSDRVSCTIWEDREVKRADLSVLDISSAIIARVESMPENIDYFYGGICVSVVISLLPSLCRLIDVADGESNETGSTISAVLPSLEGDGNFWSRLSQLTDVLFGTTTLERLISFFAAAERFSLACLFFFLAAVAERTLKQRFLYAKLFSQLTSFRRARRSQLPHFRLNKVRNIKTWLSVRSYLKKRGPQRSVDVIVSAAFIIALLLLSFLTVELLKEGPRGYIQEPNIDSARLHSEYNLEALVWCLALGVFLLRFMTLGNKTNRKYRNLSVLLTEQINLYLQIEQKPNKKEELMVANSVLKLAADLLKELESPFKMSGLSTNPYLYTITKVVILSALSGVLSEMLGFKLKLHNIKISSIK